MLTSKDNNKSEEYRSIGDSLGAELNYHEALILYNQSLCSAETDTVCIAQAYERRSLIYFKIAEYEKCLRNIDLAKNHGYPEDRIEKLNLRRIECKEMILKRCHKLSHNLIKLSHQADKNNPAISACLKLSVNDVFGRHVITDKDLKVGDIIAIEQIYVGIPRSNERFSRCHNCFKSDLMDLIPCPHCADGVIYITGP